MRVAVIGSGVVGSGVGWHLARRGASAVMIDAARPGAGVTNWTFSWVNASNKTKPGRTLTSVLPECPRTASWPPTTGPPLGGIRVGTFAGSTIEPYRPSRFVAGM